VASCVRRPGIEPGIHAHDGDTGFSISVENRPLDRRGAAVIGEQRGVDVEATKSGKPRSGRAGAGRSGHHHQLRRQRARLFEELRRPTAFRLRHWEAEFEGDRLTGWLRASSARAPGPAGSPPSRPEGRGLGQGGGWRTPVRPCRRIRPGAAQTVTESASSKAQLNRPRASAGRDQAAAGAGGGGRLQPAPARLAFPKELPQPLQRYS
jgi:hypothetical protein